MVAVVKRGPGKSPGQCPSCACMAEKYLSALFSVSDTVAILISPLVSSSFGFCCWSRLKLFPFTNCTIKNRACTQFHKNASNIQLDRYHQDKVRIYQCILITCMRAKTSELCLVLNLFFWNSAREASTASRSSLDPVSFWSNSHVSLPT